MSSFPHFLSLKIIGFFEIFRILINCKFYYHFHILIRSGDVRLNPGSETGSNNTLFVELRSVTSYGRRFVPIEHSNVRGLLRHLPEGKLLIKQTKLDILIFWETHLTENVLDNEVFINGYQLLLSGRYGKAGGGVAI